MFYDYLTSHSRLPQDGHAKFARLSQDKAIRPKFLHYSRAAIVQFSAVIVCFTAFLRQPCNKAHGYLAVVLLLS